VVAAVCRSTTATIRASVWAWVVACPALALARSRDLFVSHIPPWHPNDITRWLSGLEDGETASDAGICRARQAASDALAID
jgi:hypothetical protein